jgi:uncharacterized protein (TIGR01244 family)
MKSTKGQTRFAKGAMSDFRHVTDHFSTAPQISLADVAEAKRQGFTTLINNRPDGEAPGQPTSLEMAQAARDAGLEYFHIPVAGMPGQAQVEQMREAVLAATGPALAFCRSGTRSINTWALGQAMDGRPVAELVAAGRAAGYDLTGVLGA